MTPEEFKSLALARLDQLEDADLHAAMPDDKEAGLFAEIADRFANARRAFPGMTWDEFKTLGTMRARKGRKGNPGRPVAARAKDKTWQAARDADRIKALWVEIHPDRPRPSPPVHPHDIAAERHRISRQTVDDAVRRGNDRRIDRIAADK